MLSSTKTAIGAILATDPTITTEQRKKILSALDRDGETDATPRGYRPREVARMLGVTPRTVRQYAKRGLLTPLYVGGAKERCSLYSSTSVKALLDGEGK